MAAASARMGLWSVVRLKSRESDQMGSQIKWGRSGHDREFGAYSAGCGKPVVSSRGVTQSSVLVCFEEEGPWGRSGSRRVAGSLLHHPDERWWV